MRIKQEPGIDLDRVVLSAVVPTEHPAVLQYAIVEDQDRSDCITLGLDDSDVEVRYFEELSHFEKTGS